MAREKEDRNQEKNSAIDENRQKALESAIAQIEKNYGKGSVMKLGDKSAHMNIETVPTGSRAGQGAGRGRLSARPHHRDLRTRIQR